MLVQQASRAGPSAGQRRPRAAVLRARAAAQTEKLQPSWTGDTLFSRAVNAAIQTPMLFDGLKLLGKSLIKSTASKVGVDWEGHVRGLQSRQQELDALRAELEDPAIEYPSYYLQQFHAYTEGNLSWLAAMEVEPATYVMAARTFKEEPRADTALTRLRTSITQNVRGYHEQHGLQQPRRILDCGCSVGVSTQWLQREWPEAELEGLDLSPYFLAVAALGEREKPKGQRIRFRHGLAEHTPYESGRWDLVSHQFVIHECPPEAICSFMQEAHRVLTPRGVLCMVDNNPRSATIQGLPPFVATLMKATEPWSDVYYQMDVEAAMRESGFEQVVTLEVDHRHRAVLGIRA